MSSSGVEFEEDSFGLTRPSRAGAGQLTSSAAQTFQRFGTGRNPVMVQWLINKGWAKTPQSAQSFLVGVIIINIIITFVMIKYFIL